MPLGKFLLPFFLLTLVSFGEQPKVTAVPEAAARQFQLSPFYRKFLEANGVPIVASEKVSDFALLEVRYLAIQMTHHRPELLPAIAKNHVRLAIMAPDEFTTQIPEHHDLIPKDYWDWRARGLGATAVRPAMSCGEENLLGYPGDPYWQENIFVHEFGHVIHERGMNSLDPTFDQRLLAAYQASLKAHRWIDTYAATNHKEYWAEGVQSWFDTNRENDSEHNSISTREKLKLYDPPLAALLREVLGDEAWRYEWPAKRNPASPHLAGYDPKSAPRFAWPQHLVEARAQYRAAKETPTPAASAPQK